MANRISHSPPVFNTTTETPDPLLSTSEQAVQAVASNSLSASSSHSATAAPHSKKRKFEKIEKELSLECLPLKRIRGGVDPEFQDEDDCKDDGLSLLEAHGLTMAPPNDFDPSEGPTNLPLPSLASTHEDDLTHPDRLEGCYPMDFGWGAHDSFDTLVPEQIAQLKAIKDLFFHAYIEAFMGFSSDLSVSNVLLKSNAANKISAVLINTDENQVSRETLFALLKSHIHTYTNGNTEIFKFLAPDPSFLE